MHEFRAQLRQDEGGEVIVPNEWTQPLLLGVHQSREPWPAETPHLPICYRPDVSTWQNFPTTANVLPECVTAGLGEGLGASSEGRAKGSLSTMHVQVVLIREGAGREEPTGAFSKIIGVNRYGDLFVRAICAIHHRPPYDAPHAHPPGRHSTGYLRPPEAQLDEKICGPA
jgi:hypothetical protein